MFLQLGLVTIQSVTQTPDCPDTHPENMTSQRRAFTLRQRILLWLISWAGYLVIRLIGCTLRFSYSVEEGGPANFYDPPVIYSFWHRCVVLAAYRFRNRKVQVMTSSSFDGEYIARIISRLGFDAVRGSSSRGGARGLLQMRQKIQQGCPVAFTIDGPRGPIYVAKPGPVMLAKASGAPMAAFHMAVDRAWVLNSWDRMMIPKPFARAYFRVSRLIVVPSEMDSQAEQDHYHAELQAALERVRDFAEAHVRSPDSCSGECACDSPSG